MKSKTLLAALAAAAIASLAQAHAPKLGHNGGPQADAGSFHVEVVPKGKVLQIFLRDHGDRAVSTSGFKGTAIFMIDGKPLPISLMPAGDNTLKGEAEADLPAQPKGAVQITTASGSTVQAKF